MAALTAKMLESFAKVYLSSPTLVLYLKYLPVTTSGGSNCSDGEIRLVGGQSQNEGVVEICFSGVWGTICDDGWDSSDARVACRQLGYIQGNHYHAYTLILIQPL